MSKKTPEPGEVDAPDLGIPGPAEPMPIDDAEHAAPTLVNDYDE
jgi:hypothetical protein